MKTLTKIDVGDGLEAEIFERDDGSTYWSPGFDVWLTADPELSSAAVPAGTLVAGEMRPGSATVEVRDGEKRAETVVVAGGRFLALVTGKRRFRQIFVVFREEDGGIVLPERGEELKREPVDADVGCPACEGRDWDRAEWRVPADEGGGRRRAVVCRTCGHAPLGVGVIDRRRSADEPPLEAEPRPLSSEPTAAEIVEVASFPVYLADAGRAALGGMSWTGGRILALSLATRLADSSVEVTSAGGRVEPAECARNQLFMYLQRALSVEPDLHRDVRALRRQEMGRRLAIALDHAPVGSVTLRVEGEAVEASLVEHEGAWAASTGLVTVKGRNIAPVDVALRRLRPDDEIAPT